MRTESLILQPPLDSEFPINTDNFYIPVLGRQENYAMVEEIIQKKEITPSDMYELLAGVTETFYQEDLDEDYHQGFKQYPADRNLYTVAIVKPFSYLLKHMPFINTSVSFALYRIPETNLTLRHESTEATIESIESGRPVKLTYTFNRDSKGTVNPSYEKRTRYEESILISRMMPNETTKKLNWLQICELARNALEERPVPNLDCEC